MCLPLLFAASSQSDTTLRGCHTTYKVAVCLPERGGHGGGCRGTSSALLVTAQRVTRVTVTVKSQKSPRLALVRAG